MGVDGVAMSGNGSVLVLVSLIALFLMISLKLSGDSKLHSAK